MITIMIIILLSVRTKQTNKNKTWTNCPCKPTKTEYNRNTVTTCSQVSFHMFAFIVRYGNNRKNFTRTQNGTEFSKAQDNLDVITVCSN